MTQTSEQRRVDWTDEFGPRSLELLPDKKIFLIDNVPVGIEGSLAIVGQAALELASVMMDPEALNKPLNRSALKILGFGVEPRSNGSLLDYAMEDLATIPSVADHIAMIGRKEELHYVFSTKPWSLEPTDALYDEFNVVGSLRRIFYKKDIEEGRVLWLPELFKPADPKKPGRDSRDKVVFKENQPKSSDFDLATTQRIANLGKQAFDHLKKGIDKRANVDLLRYDHVQLVMLNRLLSNDINWQCNGETLRLYMIEVSDDFAKYSALELVAILIQMHKSSGDRGYPKTCLKIQLFHTQEQKAAHRPTDVHASQFVITRLLGEPYIEYKEPKNKK